MKTGLTQHKSMVATLVVASALVCIPPAFAETDGGGRVQEISADGWRSSMAANSPEYEGAPAAVPPSFEEPWNDSEGPALAPAPEAPAEPEAGSMFVPPPPVGLIEQFGHPPISPSEPELIPPDSLGQPAGGFVGGRFH